jgi:uncharacterized protein (DUF736 family)
MASIGSFKKVGGEFQGEIVTLSVQTRNVRIVPKTNRANDNAPSHRVYVGRAEIGAAWTKRSTDGRDYLSVKLDDRAIRSGRWHDLIGDPTLRDANPGGKTLITHGILSGLQVSAGVVCNLAIALTAIF